MKRQILALCLIATAQAGKTTEIDDLVNTSQSIRDSFKYGIQAVGGMIEHTQSGGIAPTGTVVQGYITQAQAEAYNNALVTVKNTVYSYDPGAQQYFDDQAQQAMSEVNAAVDNFVQAAEVLVEVATVNEMAQEAQVSGDARDSIAIQEYTDQNDVILDETERVAYNDALDLVENTTQVAAAYYAVAGDATLIETANSAAESMLVTYAEASQSYFDVATGTMSVEWANQTAIVSLDLNAYWKSETDIITAGSASMFFKTSPESGCWFISDPVEKEACEFGG